MAKKDARPQMIRSEDTLRDSGRDLRPWACDACDHVTRAPTPPDACPACGAAELSRVAR